MFQNVLMTTLTPLRDSNETPVWNNEVQALRWPDPLHKLTDKDVCITILKKKKKRIRTAFTTDQLRTLEKTYARTKYIDREERSLLAHSLSIGERCLKVWFQNRRMKEKKELAEANNPLDEYRFDPISSSSSPSPSPDSQPSYQDMKHQIAIQNAMHNTDYGNRKIQMQYYSNDFSEFTNNPVPAPTDHYYNNTHSYGTQYNPGIYQYDYDVQMSYLQENQNNVPDWSAHTFDITHL